MTLKEANSSVVVPFHLMNPTYTWKITFPKKGS